MQCVRVLPDDDIPAIMQHWQSMDELVDWSP